MPNSHDERYEFFVSRRGSVAAVVREVGDLLKDIADETERWSKVIRTTGIKAE